MKVTPVGITPAPVDVTVAGEVVIIVVSNLTVSVEVPAKPEPVKLIEAPVRPEGGFKVTEAALTVKDCVA